MTSFVLPVIHAPIGLPLSITNLANLETLNDQPIKTGKAISFAHSSLSSVDAIIAFLVKFNPAVESLDFSSMKNLQSKYKPPLSVTPMLQSEHFFVRQTAGIVKMALRDQSTFMTNKNLPALY